MGVAIVQISGSGDKHAENKEDESAANHNRLVGLVAVLCAACTSGFSGVYFEKILKGSTTSLWLRNVQMGLPSIVIAFITMYMKDSSVISEHGMLGGYSPIVWTVVTVQAAGGLIVAVVVKGTFTPFSGVWMPSALLFVATKLTFVVHFASSSTPFVPIFERVNYIQQEKGSLFANFPLDFVLSNSLTILSSAFLVRRQCFESLCDQL